MSSNSGIPVLRRAVRVLETLAEPRPHTAKSLAIELRIPPATCYRILHTLATARWIRRESDGTYRISHGVALLGMQATQLSQIVNRLVTPLAALATGTRLTAKVSVADGDESLMIARHEFPKDYIVSQRPGLRTSLLVGSAGAVLLSREPDARLETLLQRAAAENLPGVVAERVRARIREVRKHGHTTDLGETRSFVHAVSIPVELPFFGATAALTVIGLPEDIPADRVKTLVRAMQRTRREIEASAN